MIETSTATVDPQLFREVMGHYPTGVVVVTGRDDDGDILAMVVGTFNSVSLDPPLVSFMPMKTSRTFARMQDCSSLCINVLGGEEEDIVLTIAQRWENKLDGIDWRPSPSGDPILGASIAWIDTRIQSTIEAGDHWIVLCSVQDMAVSNSVTPLIFFQGGYGSFVCTSLMARMDHEILPAIHAAHGARAEIEQLANTIDCEVTVFTTVSEDELATVLSATGPGVEREGDFGRRVPMVPPVGDTYFFDRPVDSRIQWVNRLRDQDDEVKQIHLDRLTFIEQRGFSYSLLPADAGRAAYDSVRDATAQYSSGRMTPSQERSIRRSMAESPVDYHVAPLDPAETYDVGSLVLPVRDRNGTHSMTLRLAQLPLRATTEQIDRWLTLARDVVAVLES